MIPVADMSQHLLAHLAFFIQSGYGIYVDVNGREVPGQDKFCDLLRHSDPFPLSFVEQYSITEASAELMTSTYAGHLVLGGMGLGGWSFDGIDRLTVLGASGDPDPHTQQFKDLLTLQATYIDDTFGKFPGTVPTVWIMNYLQAQHIDLDYYDKVLTDKACLSTHKEHHEVWH